LNPLARRVSISNQESAINNLQRKREKGDLWLEIAFLQ